MTDKLKIDAIGAEYAAARPSPRGPRVDVIENLEAIEEAPEVDKYAISHGREGQVVNLETVVEEASKEEDEDAIIQSLVGQAEIGQPDIAAVAAAVKSCGIEASGVAMKTLKDCGANGQDVKDAIVKGLGGMDNIFERLAIGVDWCHKTCVDAKVCSPVGDLEIETPTPKATPKAVPEAVTEAVTEDTTKVAAVAEDSEAKEDEDIVTWTREDCGVEGRADEDEAREGVSAAVAENCIKDGKETIDSVANMGHLASIPESPGSKKGKHGRMFPFNPSRPSKWGKGRKKAADDASLNSARSNLSNISGMFRMRKRGKGEKSAADDDSLGSARSNRSGKFRIGIRRKPLGFKNKENKIPMVRITAE